MIKFGDIKIGKVARKHIAECLDKNEIACGSKVKLFEEKWAALFGTKHAVAVSTGSAACISALLSLYKFGAKRGDKVIVPGLSFVATGTSVVFAGFEPVYCDIHENSLVIDESKLEDLIKKYKPVAVFPVTLMGNAYNAEAVKVLCEKYRVYLITDNCEGAGCQYNGKYIESYSDMSVMSNYLAHLVIAGQNGVCSCNDDDFRDAILSVRTHGRKPNQLYFDHELMGTNFLPSNLHASIGLEQIEDFQENFDIRKKNWQYLRDNLDKYSGVFNFADPLPNSLSSPHAFSMTLNRKSKIKFQDFSDYIEKSGIEIKRNFGVMYEHGCLYSLGYNRICPNAEWVGNNGGHIGVHRYITQDDLEYIIETITGYFK